MFLLPTRKQWQKWSLPSRLTAIGTFIGLISLIFAFFSYLHPLRLPGYNKNSIPSGSTLEYKDLLYFETIHLKNESGDYIFGNPKDYFVDIHPYLWNFYDTNECKKFRQYARFLWNAAKTGETIFVNIIFKSDYFDKIVQKKSGDVLLTLPDPDEDAKTTYLEWNSFSFENPKKLTNGYNAIAPCQGSWKYRFTGFYRMQYVSTKQGNSFFIGHLVNVDPKVAKEAFDTYKKEGECWDTPW